MTRTITIETTTAQELGMSIELPKTRYASQDDLLLGRLTDLLDTWANRALVATFEGLTDQQRNGVLAIKEGQD